jgi:hypothetical protein
LITFLSPGIATAITVPVSCLLSLIMPIICPVPFCQQTHTHTQQIASLSLNKEPFTSPHSVSTKLSVVPHTFTQSHVHVI